MSSQSSTEVQKKSRPLRCVVVSDKMNKSRVGRIERMVKHPDYDKYIRRSTKVMFHDEENATKVGDTVLVTPTRPLSARKKFNLLQVVRRGEE